MKEKLMEIKRKFFYFDGDIILAAAIGAALGSMIYKSVQASKVKKKFKKVIKLGSPFNFKGVIVNDDDFMDDFEEEIDDENKWED